MLEINEFADSVKVKGLIINLSCFVKELSSLDSKKPERSKGPKALRAEANKVIKEVSIESFLELLPNDLIEVNELAKMYNNYFGTSKTARGFGMLNDIKGKFVKTSPLISGKRITYYRKV